MPLDAETPLAVTQIMRPRRDGFFSIERVYRDLRAHLPADVAVADWVCPYPSRGVLPRLRGALAARRVPGDLFHVTGDAHYLALFLPASRTVLTVHDCEFILRARGLKRFILWLFWLWLPVIRARAVVVPSAAARSELLGLVRVDPEQVVTIENPVSPGFFPAAPCSANGPLRVLQVGTKANKNIPRLAAALSGLPVTLFIVGRPTSAQCRALADAGVSYEWAESLSDAALAEAYRNCDILAFCSLSEGFGLPILEAQQTGRAVVTSNRAPMTDVAGDAAEFADPEDVVSMHAAFRALVENPAHRADLAARGAANVRRFDAGAVAGAYARLYRRLAAETRREEAP